MCKFSVVIPCYKSACSIEKVVTLTREEMQNLGEPDVEFILVNDCSPDEGKTSSVLRKMAEEQADVTVIELAKNSGQHNAVMAGLNYASGDYIIAMDDDMQTHPSQLKILIDEIYKGYDVVYGYYPEKKHNLFRNFGSYINYLSARILLGKPKHLKTSSFWVMRKFVRDTIIEYKNSYAYLQGLILRTTRNISSVPIKHFKREYGTSTYTLKALFRLYSSIIGFSLVPLRLCTYCGYFFSAVGMLAALGILIRKIMHPAMAMGWPSTMCAISFFFGLTFLFMGLIGEYIGRIFLGLNREPQYVVREVVKKSRE
ncbi:MAG: glycosyltransferase family 2 protein [Clostridia bacterium]|nr:glycosyltransferase family 2 protein [Clostridia bacterium]